MTDGASRFFTIAQITRYLKALLESDFLLQDLWLVGEVSNYVRSAAGHVYFTLKDEEAQIRCVLWRSYVTRQMYLPRQGEAIVAHGYVSLYEVGGNYQFYVDEIQPAGAGQLHMQFELLKQRLQEEGLFAAGRKRPLPPFPRCIGVATSPTGAVWRDICNVLRRRYPLVQVILAPCAVQGVEAPEQIAAALDALNALPEVEIIIVARGGGSLEELQAFNDERVARAIYRSRAPVISGVGHETDFTIADFAADVRAPTPSAAAELAVADQTELRARLRQSQERLASYIEERLAQRRRALAYTAQRLQACSPRRVLAQHRQQVDDKRQRAIASLMHCIALRRQQLRGDLAHLQSLSPSRTLERGYAIVRRRVDGQIVRGVAQVQPRDRVDVQLRDGAFAAAVEEITKRD